jgi:toxin ParE1/3/4
VKIVVRPSAAADIEDAYRWYQEKQSELGDLFLAAVQTALERVTENPKAHPLVHRDVRRARLQRFPYGLFYREYAGAIVVVACFHARRDPRRWRARR